MKNPWKHLLATSFAATSIFAATVAWAQESPPPEGDGSGNGERHEELAVTSPRVDRLLTHLLMGENHSEINLGQLATRLAKNDQVRNFAEQMVRENTDFINRLKQVSGRAVPGQPGTRESAEAMQQGQPQQGSSMAERLRTFAQQQGIPGVGQQQPQEGGASPQQRIAGYPPQESESGINLAQLSDQWRNLRDSMLRQELEQSENFDKAYLGQSLATHTNVLAALQTFESYASPQLKPVIEEGKQAAQRRLDEARNLLGQLNRSSDGQDGQRQ